MKLGPPYASSQHTGPQIRAADTGTGTTVLALICVGSTFFILIVAIAVFLYQRRRSSLVEHHTLLIKQPYNKPITLRKPIPVRSSPGSAVGAGILLKKSPSPTSSKSPPGTSAAVKSSSEASLASSPEEVAASIRKAVRPASIVVASRDVRPEPISEQSAVSDSNEPIKEEQQQQARSVTFERDDPEKSGGKLGSLHFRLRYSYEKQALCVSIVKCTKLPAKESGSSSDPYVKLILGPDRQHKVKTRVLRKTLNPQYDEEFTFYGINPNQLESTSLHFLVLENDRFSRDALIGEVIFNVRGVEFDRLEKQVNLVREIMPRNGKSRNQGKGELLVSLCHQPAASRLTVVILKARNLPKMDVIGLCDPYVKIYLLSNGQRIAKKKTHVKKRTLSPVFNESFVFDIPHNEPNSTLDNLSLEFVLLDYERITKNEMIGKLMIGPGAEEADAQKHWLDISNSPRRQIAEWHKLA